MTLKTIVWKELLQRPAAMAATIVAITLGVSTLIAVRHVAVSAERHVARQLEALGANILILPKSASLQDYYGADLQEQTLPEEYVATVQLANLEGIEKLSPRLCTPAEMLGKPVTLTGVLPQSAFESQSAWQSLQPFGRKHVGCAKASVSQEPSSPTAIVTTRAIDRLEPNEVLIGADVAESVRIAEGADVELAGRTFRILGVLPRTGTVDDSRVFAHLHTVQELSGAGQVASAIEVIGCCEDAAGRLVPELANLLPEAKVVTVSQVVETQVGVNRLVNRTSALVVAVLAFAGGAGLASTMAMNVRERRREIGTLMALGAPPRFISGLFLLKAILLAAAGSAVGCLIGAVLALSVGPQWAGVEVQLLPPLFLIAVAGAFALAMLSALWPARMAAKVDPCICFREI
ncbi:MAG: FtsX-like permease family protein [Pirellulales bacterium]